MSRFSSLRVHSIRRQWHDRRSIRSIEGLISFPVQTPVGNTTARSIPIKPARLLVSEVSLVSQEALKASRIESWRDLGAF